MNLFKVFTINSAVVACITLFGLVSPVTADAHKSPKLQVGGYVMLDYDRYDGFYNKDSDDSEKHFELRRSKLSFELTPHNDIKAKVQFSYNEEYRSDPEFKLANAYVSYGGFKGFKIRVGKMKEPYSLEYQTSSKNLATIERSLITTAFAPGSNVGLQLYKNDKTYTWAVGVFQEDDSWDMSSDSSSDNNSDKSDAQALTSRLTYAFTNENEQLWHVGGSLSLRDIKGEKIKFKERGEVNSAQNIIRSASMDVDKLNLLQLESAFSSGPLRIQGEAAMANIKELTGESWRYSGFYLQASYLLSGDSYHYNKGKFKAVKPASIMGSWELLARYSSINLQDNQLGSKTSINLLGLNYYASQNFRLMVNLLFPTISGKVVSDDQTGNAISVRGQYQF